MRKYKNDVVRAQSVWRFHLVHDDGPSTYFKHTLPAVHGYRNAASAVVENKIYISENSSFQFLFSCPVKTNLESSSAGKRALHADTTTPFGV